MENIRPDQMKIYLRMAKLGICSEFLCDENDDSFMTESELAKFENYCTKLKNRRHGASLHELVKFLTLHCVRQDPTGRCLQAVFRAGVSLKLLHDNNTQNTLLHIATYRGFPLAVKAIIDAGVDVDAVDAQGMEPLFYAVQGTKNNPARGTEADYYKIFQMIVEAKGGVEKCLYYTSAHGGKTRALIFIACESGATRIVQALINASVDINQRDNMKCDRMTAIQTRVSVLGETPLHFAVKSGNLKLVKLLLKSGANTRTRTYGEHATLPVEKVLNGNYSMRIANEIFRWELDHNINTNDTPPVEKGFVHCSDNNVETIHRFVEKFLETGEVTGHLSSMPIFKMQGMGANYQAIKIDEVVNEINSKTISMKLCAKCGEEKPDMKKCSQCKSAHYCNSTCQKEHWKEHKKECKKM